MADFTSSRPNHRTSLMGNHSTWPTPPTEFEHDFSQDMDTADKDKSLHRLPELKDGAAVTLHSPPASPVQGWSDKLPPIQSPNDSVVQSPLPHITDRQLFSESGAESQTPLFHHDERSDSLSPVCRPAAAAAASAPLLVEPAPQKPSFNGIYSIFPQFQGADREFFRKYRQNCYQEVKQMTAWKPVSEHKPIVTHNTVKHTAAVRPFRVTKPKENKPAMVKSKVPRVSTAALPVAKHAKTPTTKRERQSASAEPQARKRAPPSKPVVVDNWLEIADYSPPTETLDAMSLRLRVHWKGVPNDLSSDPEVRHLHPQEIEIAQELKLPANQYLANKRRIFEARLKSIRERKNFTKTAAQQACNIDVNKTSQLYEAYEKVGWFDEANFKQWLM